MKQTLYILLTIILFSCSSKNKKETEIINFLNNTATYFDKNKLEFIDLKPLDTVYVTEYESVREIYDLVNYETGSKLHFGLQDTSYREEIQSFRNINWLIKPYTHILYDYIVDSGAPYGLEDDVPNKFLNQIFEMDHTQFKKKMFDNEIVIGDKTFKEVLIDHLAMYDRLKEISSPDSVNKYINIEKEKQEEVIGVLYESKLRINNKLFRYVFVFDENSKILDYALLD